MLKKIISGSLEVKEVIEDKDKIAELEAARLQISADGKVGIGTANPSTKLDVK